MSCSDQKSILIFSKTEGFRHTSIEPGIEAIKNLGLQNNFSVKTTEDSRLFNHDSLLQFDAVLFLSTTGDVLNHIQQAEFERYIQSGGGYVGIHAATDTEYDWPWYNGLVGAYFNGHPRIQEAVLEINDYDHQSTKNLPREWKRTDEWYNFKDINPDIKVLIDIDEGSYEGGTNGEDHPISWYHQYDGGKSFYTAMGHKDESFQDPEFLNHLQGGIEYAMDHPPLNYDLASSLAVPDENRFNKEVLDFNLDEPMELDELPGIGILFIERRGRIKLYDFELKTTKLIGHLDVFYENEDGLLGLAVDPAYVNNNWIYLFYSAPGEAPDQRVSRFELIGDSLSVESEKVLLTIPTIRKCCHSGGALEFGPDGNLFIGVGDNTNPFESSGYAPIDERPGRELWDAQRSAANTNDLRGKILRITPNVDGTYAIPEGNLFPEGTPNTRPEIYVMGCRNPFRFDIDSKTGFLYWGDVGPDAGKGDSTRGPHGMGEFDQARNAGNFGWPYTRGNNQVYYEFDFNSNKSGKVFDPNKLINDSPNNTGISELPPAKESMIWYSYSKSQKFPWLGDGGVNPMAGPVFHKDNFEEGTSTFPPYFEDKLFVYEWMRDWIYLVTLDDRQRYVKAEPFMPETEFSHPMDMLFGSDGNLYSLEYGQKWNVQNIDARLSRISYNAGNRVPMAKIQSDIAVGAAPLKVNMDGTASQDFDNDKLSYEWFFTSDDVQARGAFATYTFKEPGVYTVKLRVTDTEGNSSENFLKIMVGNDPPSVVISVDAEDFYYWDGRSIAYKVSVTDREDGSTVEHTIDHEDVKVTLNYLPEGEDLILATLGHQQHVIPKGLALINAADCKACHAIDQKVNGPSYKDISLKYSIDDMDNMVSHVIKGSTGIWGETMMSAHPQLSIEEVKEMVKYILSLDPGEQPEVKSIPLEGSIVFNQHKRSENGKYILMASYRDKGHKTIEGLQLSDQKKLIFGPPIIQAEDSDNRSDGLNN
jgi:cytochrome c